MFESSTAKEEAPSPDVRHAAQPVEQRRASYECNELVAARCSRAARLREGAFNAIRVDTAEASSSPSVSCGRRAPGARRCHACSPCSSGGRSVLPRRAPRAVDHRGPVSTHQRSVGDAHRQVDLHVAGDREASRGGLRGFKANRRRRVLPVNSPSSRHRCRAVALHPSTNPWLPLAPLLVEAPRSEYR